MISASQIKKGMAVEIHSQPHVIQSVTVQTPSARGASTLYKIRAHNAVTGQKTDLSCRGEETFKEVDLIKKKTQFLYRDRDVYCFMDLEDYSQFELQANLLADEALYLLEEMEVIALEIDGKVQGIQLPDTVELTITDCDPGIKGASATARPKPATMETGLVVQVPEYLESGEKIRIDTRTAKYLGRA